MGDNGKVMMRPGNPQAEAAVLGAILQDGGRIETVKSMLRVQDFQEQRHQDIYHAMLEVAARGYAIDLITVSTELETHGALGRVTPGYVTQLVIAPASPFEFESYARLVQEASARRELIIIGSEIVKDAYQPGDPGSIVAKMRDAIRRVDGSSHNGQVGVGHQESVTAYLDLLQRRYADKDKPKLMFGWSGLERLMPYLDAGTLVGIVAESGAGKTSFLENCAENWAQHGWRVLFCHYELSTSMMLDRRMQRQTGIPIRNLQLGGRLEGDQYTEIVKVSERMAAWSGSVRYVHCPGWPMSRVVASIRAQQDAGGIDVAIVDYLNKVQMVDRHGMTSAQLRGQDVEEFKVCLEELGIVGLMAAQFDKAAKSKRHRSLADARDTGELDDKANVGIVIDRPRGKDNRRSATAKVYIVKCNAGMEGCCDMVFNGTRLAFYEVEEGTTESETAYAAEDE